MLIFSPEDELCIPLVRSKFCRTVSSSFEEVHTDAVGESLRNHQGRSWWPQLVCVCHPGTGLPVPLDAPCEAANAMLGCLTSRAVQEG